MTVVGVATILASCFLVPSSVPDCIQTYVTADTGQVASVAGVNDNVINEPVFTGSSLDVEISARAAVVWDVKTGQILYEREANTRRPVASLSKLLSALLVREITTPDKTIEIPSEALVAQRKGANIKLPVGEHASVNDLLGAGLTASANDAMTSLAVGLAGSEDTFAEMLNDLAASRGLADTKVSNATGLGGGEQYSTASDVKKVFSMTYGDKLLREKLVSATGVLNTDEGSSRQYKSTNKLLGTYFPVLSAKTGYTIEAGENLVVMTYGSQGQVIGAVVLGSEARFQDMKTLVEWIWRNYTWK